ncbi:MAG: glycosyltransferase family 39 protein [Armatimonadetes bacterium]|nr:glycosyltransferase family 39 protein [Armatimonadota bacterium]
MTVKSPAPKTELAKYVPLLLVLFALVLRLSGITWALPDKTRAYSYHPDESVVVGHSLDVNPFAGKVDPGFYNYGSLSLLLNGAVIHAGRAAGLIDFAAPDNRPGGLALPTATELLTARLITALLGAGTVGFLFGTGRLLYSRTAGIVAGLGYAVAPLAVQHGHFATVDIPAVFFIAGSLYFAATALPVENEKRNVNPPRALLLCGLFAGLAASTKYNAGLVVLPGIVAWYLTVPRRPLPLLLLLGGTAFGFLLGCPGVLLNTPAFIGGLRYEAAHVAEGHGEVFVNTAPGFIYHIVSSLRWGLTLPLLVLCLWAVGVAVARRRRGDALLAAFALPYYLLIGLASVKFARYVLPLLPVLFLLAGAAWDGWRKSNAERGYRLLAGFALVGATGFSLALNGVMGRTDARDAAAAYIRALPNVRTVGFPAGPWFYSPTLHPYLTHPYPFVGQVVAAESEDLRLIPSVRFGADGQPERTAQNMMVPVEWDAALLTAPVVPDALALSEAQYADSLRVGNKDAAAYLSAAETAYPVHKNFTNPVTLFGLPVVRIYTEPGDVWHGLPTQALPPDMLYTNPSVSVWSK